MPTAEDVAAVRRLYAAVAAGDIVAVSDCFDEDAVWHLPGTNALSGTHRGWPAIRDDLLARQGPLSGGTFRAQLLDLAVGTGTSSPSCTPRPSGLVIGWTRQSAS